MIARAVALGTVWLVAGCASTPPASDSEAWTSGRLSVRVEATAERPLQMLSAAFELQGSDDHGELRLLSPLGTLLVAARWAPGSAVIRTPEGERSFDSLDELSRQALGESLPLAALPDWVAGRPWPAVAHSRHADGFEQLGWTVLTARQAEGWISAERRAAPAIQLRVRRDRAQP